MKPIHCWFRTALGRAVMETECRLVAQRLASLYTRSVLQIGAYGRGQRPAVFGDTRQWLLDEWSDGPVDIVASPQELPLENESMDAVVLVHQLEFSEHPHQILREAARVLSPEGYLLVLTFNPLSFWGVRRALSGRRGSAVPWLGRYLTPMRIEDWMTLLGMKIERRDGVFFRPPVNNAATLRRLEPMESWGRRYMRWLGGVHMTMGHKRVAGTTPLIEDWQPRLAVIPGGLASGSVSHQQFARRPPKHGRRARPNKRNKTEKSDDDGC